MKTGTVVRAGRARRCLAVATVALALVTLALAAEAPQVMEARRLAEQAQTYRVSSYPNLHNLPVADGSQEGLSRWQAAEAAERASRSIIQDNYMVRSGLGVTGATEPGLKAGMTVYDFQHNDAAPHMIATNGSGSPIHFTWTYWFYAAEGMDFPDRFVNFQTYNSATASFLFGDNGTTMYLGGGNPHLEYDGFPTLDIDDSDRAHVAFHGYAPADQYSGDRSSFEFDQSDPLLAVFTQTQLFQSSGPTNPNSDDDRIWPHVSVDQIAGSPDVIHVVAHTIYANDDIVYWRFKSTDSPQWEGPYVLDSTPYYSYNVACDRTTDKCALITNDMNVTAGNPLGINQVTYRESSSNGDDWGPVSTTGLGDLNETFITHDNDSKGPGAWAECVGDYDNAGNLHVIWVEQRFNTGGAQGSLKHWDKASNMISTITQAYYDNKGVGGGRDLNIAFPSLGFGDGSTICGATNNLDFLYVTYEQYGGPSLAQQSDKSSKGYMNGEVYMVASADAGLLWSPPINLTNTFGPGCDPAVADSCPSEIFPSIARTVDDTIHIMYIADRDAGDIVFGEGLWTYNPVMYYRIPGGSGVQPVCPSLEPNFGAVLSDANGPDCEYNTPPNTSLQETLTLSNVGNGPMSGVVSRTYLNPPSGTWLTLGGLGSYNIPASGADLVSNVTMDATGLAEGIYSAQISITHNDPTKTSPYVIPVDFFVFSNFACPKYVVLHTAWLELEVSNISRVAIGPNRDLAQLRGMYWPPYSLRGSGPTADSGFYSIFDGSLIIARPPVDISVPPDGILDTVVYRYVYGTGNYAKGFRALSDLVVDTGAYGTGGGVVTARASQTTVDSLLGIEVKYELPQSDDSSLFVLVHYTISNRTATTFTGLIFGEAVDFDVRPSTQYAIRQDGNQNTAGFSTAMNLIYQQGIDSSATSLNQAEKYFGGMTAIQSTVSRRTWAAPNDPWLLKRPGGGWSEGYLYSEMMKNGFEVRPPVPTPTGGGWVDMHSVVGFDRNVTLTPTTVKHYTLGFVSSHGGPTNSDLIAQTRKAWKFAFGWQDFVSLDTVEGTGPKSYPYFAVGSHEDGPTSGCCGCVITKVSDPSGLFSVTPDADPCTGMITFAGFWLNSTHTATFRLSTPTCGGPTYTEDLTMTIRVYAGCGSCPHQGDIVLSGFIDVNDVLQCIKVAFSNGTDITDPGCPTSRCDVNCSRVVDVQDVIYIIKTAFANGPAPCNPFGG